MTANPCLAAELQRQQALRLVADMQAEAWKDQANALAERLSHLLVALTDCDVVIVDGEARLELCRLGRPAFRALADAITAARIALDALNASDEEAA